MFLAVLSMCEANAYYSYVAKCKILGERAMSHIEFKKLLADELIDNIYLDSERE